MRGKAESIIRLLNALIRVLGCNFWLIGLLQKSSAGGVKSCNPTQIYVLAFLRFCSFGFGFLKHAPSLSFFLSPNRFGLYLTINYYYYYYYRFFKCSIPISTVVQILQQYYGLLFCFSSTSLNISLCGCGQLYILGSEDRVFFILGV